METEPLLLPRPRQRRPLLLLLVGLTGLTLGSLRVARRRGSLSLAAAPTPPEEPATPTPPDEPAVAAAATTAGLVARARVELDCGALMPLYANVTVELDAAVARALGATIELAVRYSPRAATSLPALWTPALRLSTNDTGGGELLRRTLTAVRLRPGAAYRFELFASSAAEGVVSAWAANATTCASGFVRLDAFGGPFVRVVGAQRPSYAMATFEIGRAHV